MLFIVWAMIIYPVITGCISKLNSGVQKTYQLQRNKNRHTCFFPLHIYPRPKHNIPPIFLTPADLPKPAARRPVDSGLALLICSDWDALFHKKNQIDAVFFSPSRNSIRALAWICRPITGLKCFCREEAKRGEWMAVSPLL